MKFHTMTMLSLALATTAFSAAPANAAALVSPSASASQTQSIGPRVMSGQKNGMSWTASNRIIGQTPTSDVLPPSNTIGGGDPIYKPSADKNGTVALIMERPEGLFICSGSVLADGRSIATAAHCVSDGFGTPNPISTRAYFFSGDPDVRTPFEVGGVSAPVAKYFVNPGYTGEVIDQNDIAILRLSREAPDTATRYDLYTDELTGTEFNVAGYGTRSTVGGASGNTPPAGARTGFLREGDNIYDYSWGNDAFAGFFTDIIAGENFFGTAEIEFSFVSDFDNGLAAQSQSYRICLAVGGTLEDCEPFNDNGLGAREVGIAGGDSGGPGFVDGKLASINSYGLTFGFNFGDFDPNVIVGGQERAVLNAGWGEFSGYVPIFIHEDFIRSTLVPAPGTWATLMIGLGLTGVALQRRRKLSTAA